MYFIVTNPDGSRAWYGNYDGMNATDLTAYYITRFQDANGNFITYHYTKPYNKSLCITEIKFSANVNGFNTPLNSIKFNYKTAKRIESGYLKGVKYEKVELLSDIQVFTNNNSQLFKKYVISHITDSHLGYERVSQIQEYNSALEPANPVVFEYNTSGINLAAIEPMKPYTNNFNFNEVKHSGDFDGDGKLDFVTENKLYTNLFQSSTGGNGYNIVEPILPRSFVTTTLKDNKINQHNTVVNPVLEENNLKLRFLDLNNGQVSLSYENTYPINNLIECNLYCPDLNCDNMTNNQLNFTHQYFEGDFNGDGKSEVLLIMNKVSIETDWVLVGPGDPSLNPNPIDPDNPPPPSYECRAEMIVSNTDISFRILNTEPNASTFDTFSPPAQFSDYSFFSAKKYTGDFNGDGKTDLFVVFGDSKYQIISFYNNGGTSSRQIIGQGMLDDYIGEKQVLFGDYNGDGKTDFMMPHTTGGSGHTLWHIYYSNPNPNGGSFFVKESHNIVEYWPNTGGHFDLQTHFSSYYAMDINEDGKSDLVRVWRKHYKPSWTVNDHNTQWTVTAFANNIGNTQITGNKFTLEYSSGWNHDGDSPDLVIPVASSYKYRGLERDMVLVHNHYNRLFYVNFTKDISEDIRLKRVKASNNAIVDEIDYAPMEGAIYTSSNALNYPFIEINRLPKNYLVYRIKNISEGITKYQDFKYHGLVVHLNGLGTIGYKRTARSAWYQSHGSPRIWNVKENNPNWRGALENGYSVLMSGGDISLHNINNNNVSYVINKTTNVFSQSTTNGFYRVQLDTQITRDILTGVSTQVDYTYDPIYLLPTTVTTKNYTTSPSSPVGTKTTTTLYDNNPAGIGTDYHIGRPIEITTVTNAYNDTFTTKDIYTYTNNKLTKTEKRGNTTDSKYLVEEFEYNNIGNLTKKTLSSSGYSYPQTFSPRVTEYTYDSTERFIKTSKDIEGLISTNVSFHSVYGVVTESQNPFGHSTKSFVDNWGKVYQVTDYLGKNGYISYTKANGEYVVTKTSDDGSASVEISDALGRSKKSGKKNIDGTWSYVSTEYDFYGRKYRVSEPYSSGNPTQWTTDTFDNYGRQKTNTKPTGLVTTITYSGLTVSATDGTKNTSSTKNANGHLVSSNDNGGVINFQYYADGNLKQSNYDGTIVAMEYDEWGRKKTLNDPSAGTYTYTYNALGESLTETTPNGSTTYTYNNFGKVLTKDITTTNGTHGESSTTYYYNPTTKLIESIGYWGYEPFDLEYYYTYDTYNRLTKVVELRNDGEFEFTNEIEYDAFGRVYRERNKGESGGKTFDNWIKNTYKNGYHWQILDDATNAILWQTNNVNARGQLTSANYGNGIAVNNSYDSYGYITQSSHFNASTPSNNLMTLNTTFEPLRGNLTSRYNSMFNWNENFQYDTLDRLTHYTNLQGIQIQQTYETDGRIKQNDIGTYNYSDTSKKYRNSSIDINAEARAYYENRLGIFNDSMEPKVGWTINEPTVVTYDSTVARSGVTSLKINNTAVEEKVVHNENWIKIDNAAPTEYTYSVWVKSDGSNPQAEIFLFMKTENETGYFTVVDSKRSSTNTGWVQIEKTFLVPANIKKLGIRLDNNGTGRLWFDDVRIRKTSEAQPTERQLNISYNAFKSPYEIHETGVDKITFSYNESNNRSSMYYGGLQTNKLARQYHKHYAANGRIEVKLNKATNGVEFINYIGGDAYSAPLVLKSDGTNKEYLYLHRDYQGTILAISNQAGNVVEKRLFDAWGQLIKVQDGQGNILSGLTVLDRGYTGHEHLQSVGLVHMNGRLYDAKLHRFLQPDNYIQDPYNTQNYNRYGYVLNNPLKYVDPSGEEFTLLAAIAVGAIIGATTYTLTALLTDVPFSAGGFLKASFMGGLSGAVTFGIGQGATTIVKLGERFVFQAFAHGSTQAIMAGIQGGDPLVAFASGALSSIASSAWSGGGLEKGGEWKGLGGSWGRGDFGTVAFGTVSGGAGAAMTKGNFWQGAATGLTVSLLNHAMHSENNKTKFSNNEEEGVVPTGEMIFKDLTKEQLSEFRIIPEDAEIDPIFIPTKNGTYEGDGFYHKDFSDKKYWFKVSAGSSVTITNSGGKYHYSVYQNLPMTYLAIALGKDYAVDWQPKSKPHWTTNPFDIKK